MGKKYGPRRLSFSERIIWAIKLARMRLSDDQKFAAEVNNILLQEHILERKDFGILEKERDEDNDDDRDE